MNRLLIFAGVSAALLVTALVLPDPTAAFVVYLAAYLLIGWRSCESGPPYCTRERV